MWWFGIFEVLVSLRLYFLLFVIFAIFCYIFVYFFVIFNFVIFVKLYFVFFFLLYLIVITNTSENVNRMNNKSEELALWPYEVNSTNEVIDNTTNAICVPVE